MVVARRIALVWLAAPLIAAPPASAFDSKGHVVVEALAYRTLVEGHDGQAPRPEVLRDLINDGALDLPFCFGRGDVPPRECVDAPASNPLLAWPQPLTDRPDAAFRRQFSDVGQCFHYMATLDDAQSDVLPGTAVPRALATSAVVRCNDLLDGLLRQVVVIGGPATRRSSHGLYEFMHAVGDSFSGSHTERAEDGRIGYLRVWKPIEKLVKLPTERAARIPDASYHKWDDHRDKTYVVEGGDARCEKRTDQPYNVPYECLSPEGDRARRALTELLVLARELRLAQLAAPKGTDTAPERSDAWRGYKAKWFTPAHPCEGAECAEREKPDPPPGRYALLGLETIWNPTRDFVDIAARGTLIKYSEDLNPFLYALNASVGYRQYTDGGGGAGLVGLGVDLVLPVGLRATLGFTPAALRVTYGGDRAGPELVTRFFRASYKLKDGLFLTIDAPMEVNWLKPRVEWMFGVGLIYAPPSSKLSKDRGLLLSKETLAVRQDGAWVPPPAPYGHIEGRRGSWYVVSGVTVAETPANAVEGRHYGLGLLGGEVAWDRNRWGGRFEWVPALSVAVANRVTSGESKYLTGTLAASIRWYALKVLGLSLTPVRVEYGPKVRGDEEVDTSPGVHGKPGSTYYFQAGTRLGVMLNAGIIDILVEGPTLAWDSSPFAAKEILSFRLGIRLN
ncbi:MAG TPA: hypothetical protein PLB01_01270 [Thermoanaerobaculia bacterium]|nr:hypothetical protein [Thermoanaerobaculia bacterium]